MNHSFFTISGYLIGLIGTVSGIYFYFKGKIRKQLSYYIMHFDLFTDIIREVGRLSVLYDDKKISNLTLSELYIWNSGNTYIDNQDIAPMAPIIISSKDGEILECIVKLTTDRDNNWQISDCKNGKEITFDYIPTSKGCMIKIAHTGKSVHVSGKLKQSNIKYQRVMPTRKNPESDKRFFLFMLCITILSFLAKYIFNSDKALSLGVVTSLVSIFTIIMWQINKAKSSSISVFQEFRYGKEK
jgi:hypothetical protein